MDEQFSINEGARRAAEATNENALKRLFDILHRVDELAQMLPDDVRHPGERGASVVNDAWHVVGQASKDLEWAITRIQGFQRVRAKLAGLDFKNQVDVE